ncbi:MAG: hypothetical protein IPI65_13930 [Bacteroidetes bacterium]|nr:hypothetical protein [Bacteroidota bacterium]
MAQANSSLSLSNPHPANFNNTQKAGLAITGIGLLAFFMAWAGAANHQPLIFLIITLLCFFAGGIIYTIGTYGHLPPA